MALGRLKKMGSYPPPRFAALVLAAGTSSRMGGVNKLLAPMPDGRSMIMHTVENALASDARPVIVITGHENHRIQNALIDKPVRFLYAGDYAQGLSASLKTGISAIPEDIDAAIICLGDMPLVGRDILQTLLAAYDPAACREIVIPFFKGQRGNPVLWGRRFFSEMSKRSGDTGAKQMLDFYQQFIIEVSINSNSVLRDFDTPEMLATLHTPNN